MMHEIDMIKHRQMVEHAMTAEEILRKKEKTALEQIKQESIDVIEARIKTLVYASGVSMISFGILLDVFAQKHYDRGCNDGYETATLNYETTLLNKEH